MHMQEEGLPDRLFRNPFALRLQPNDKQVCVKSFLPPREGAPVNLQASREGKILLWRH